MPEKKVEVRDIPVRYIMGALMLVFTITRLGMTISIHTVQTFCVDPVMKG